MLTEVRDCDLLIVVKSSTFLIRKDMLKEKAVSPDHQNPQHSIEKKCCLLESKWKIKYDLLLSIYIDKCTVYTYTVYVYTAL